MNMNTKACTTLHCKCILNFKNSKSYLNVHVVYNSPNAGLPEQFQCMWDSNDVRLSISDEYEECRAYIVLINTRNAYIM